MTTFIYALTDVDGTIRYIGKSQTPEKRIKHHLWEAAANICTRKARWLRSLLLAGNRPGLQILEECSGTGCAEEIHHIALARSDGLPLVNGTDGGDHYHHTPEVLRRMKEIATERGRLLTTEQRQVLSERAKRTFTGRKTSPEVSARRGLQRRGIPISEEAKKKMSAAKKGKAPPRWVTELAHAARRGGTITEEHKEAVRRATENRMRPIREERRRREVIKKRLFVIPNIEEERILNSIMRRALTREQEKLALKKVRGGARMKDVAAELHCGVGTVWRTIRRLGIPQKRRYEISG